MRSNVYDVFGGDWFFEYPAADWNDWRKTTLKLYSTKLSEESPDSWSFDVPGYKKDEIKIEITNNVVNIRAENETRGKLNHSFGLGQDVDAEKITTKLEDGVLTLNLPKTEKAKPRQIAIG